MGTFLIHNIARQTRKWFGRRSVSNLCAKGVGNLPCPGSKRFAFPNFNGILRGGIPISPSTNLSGFRYRLSSGFFDDYQTVALYKESSRHRVFQPFGDTTQTDAFIPGKIIGRKGKFPAKAKPPKT